MSSPDVLTSLKWLISLEGERQSFLIKNLAEPETQFTPEENDHLTKIVMWIHEMQGHTPRIYLTAALVNFGMRDVFASQLIDAVASKAPLLNLDAKKLLSFDERKYSRAVETIIEKWYVENFSEEQLLEYSQLSREELELTRRWIRDYILFRYMRGELTSEALRTNLAQDLRFPEKYISLLVTLLEKHKKTISENFVFRNTQDVFFRLQRLEANQLQTINLTIELINYLKQVLNRDKGQP